jgi:uncharacterized protein YecE (DUF72 family)
MIDKTEVESLLNWWRQKRDAFAYSAKALKTTGYYGRMAEAERDVAELIVKDLETLLLKAKG